MAVYIILASAVARFHESAVNAVNLRNTRTPFQSLMRVLPRPSIDLRCLKSILVAVASAVLKGCALSRKCT